VRRPIIGIVLTIGVLLIAAGWSLTAEAYLSSLLLELGATVLLLLPLLWIERIFEQRVERGEARTRSQVAEVSSEVADVSEVLAKTRQSVADLQEQLSSRLQETANADAGLVERAKSDVSFDTLAALFRRAAEVNALSDRGLRVVVPGQWERLRFRHAFVESQRALWLSVEGPAGNDIGVATLWRAGEGAVDAMAAIVEAWVRNGSYPGDGAMDAQRIFERLLLTLEVAIRGRRARGETQLHPVVELPSTTWAMTDYGLENLLEDYYAIPGGELATDEGLQHWRQHMQDKVWVREQDASARESGDADFWMVSEIAHHFFSGPQ
jgi:hypothetical protein